MAVELFEDTQKQLMAILLLRIQIHWHIIGTGGTHQLQNGIEQLGHGPLLLGNFVAGMERRKFDGDTGAAHAVARAIVTISDTIAILIGTNDLDGMEITSFVEGGILGGQRRFTEHIVGVGVAFIPVGFPVGNRLFNGMAEDKVFTHNFHGLAHRLPNYRLTQLVHQAADNPGGLAVVIAIHGDNLASQHQPPG